MNKPAVLIENLEVNLDGFKLEDINLTIPKGVILGLVGRNGAGKTTLIKTICGIYSQSKGNIYLNGYNRFTNEVDYLSELGVMPEKGLFNEYFKINKLKKILKSVYPNFNELFFSEALKSFKLNNYKRIKNLSLGNQKLLNIITAMSLNPNILILDEPTANVDPISKRQIISLLQGFLEDDNKTIIYSTHQTEELDNIADYLLFIDDGKIILNGLKDDLVLAHSIMIINEANFNQYKADLIGYRKTPLGYEVLLKKRDVLKSDLDLVKTPTIESLMFYYLGADNEIIF